MAIKDNKLLESMIDQCFYASRKSRPNND